MRSCVAERLMWQADPRTRKRIMDNLVREASRGLRFSSDLFLNVEHAIYIALGFVLSITALIALGSAAYTLWTVLLAWSGGAALLVVIDQLLFVLMVAEILHTVRVSIRSGALTCEPFLTVGLIASIRRVLVITLESSQTTPGKSMAAGQEEMFRASMIELGVLGGLILIMVISIFLIRRSGGRAIPATGV